MPHLFANNPSRMFFEHLKNYFHLEDFANEFSQLFQLCFHITQGHIPRRIAHIFEMVHILTMTKHLGGIHPIVMEKTLCRNPSVGFVTKAMVARLWAKRGSPRIKESVKE
jgi:hypothetical protein